jgi:hypothetical protein
MIDLHCHSYFSDGLLSPEDLLQKAVQAGVKILALTDHDTTDGLVLLNKAAYGHDIQLINGIELSASWKKYTIHVIGLNINPEQLNLKELLIRQNNRRIARGKLIAEKLNMLGIVDTWQKVCRIANHERVGRPHFAQLLVNERLCPDMKTAFKRYLVRGKFAYIPTTWLPLHEIVTTIVGSGGQATIAHPLKYQLTHTKLHELITVFKEAGGTAIEVVSGRMNAEKILEVAQLCQRFDLLASTGSDYHGDQPAHISLGHQAPLPLNCTPIWHQWTQSVSI